MKIIILLVLLLPFALSATYYVDNQHASASDSNPGTEGLPWNTIQHAADSVSAGDIVFVKEGAYEEIATISKEGSPGNEITFAARGKVTVCGWKFSNIDYVRIIGFNIDCDYGSCSNNAGFLLTNTNNYLEFWNNNVTDCTSNGFRMSNYGYSCSNCLVIGNYIGNIGYGMSGSATAGSIYGNDNFIAYNEIDRVYPDGFIIMGIGSQYLNNYFHGMSEEFGGHTDLYQTGSNPKGFKQILIEATFQVGSGNQGNEHSYQISHTQQENCGGICGEMTENIFRRNVWHNLGSGSGINQADDGEISFTRYYHNTYAEANELIANTPRGISYYSSGVRNTSIYNNIEYETWSNDRTYADVYYVQGGLSVDYNLAYDPDGPVVFQGQWNEQSNSQSNIDPGIVDYDNDDFHITNTGGAYENAGPLTKTTNTGTGSTFFVDDAKFFRGDNTAISQYGGNLVTGDVITVGTDTVRIASISGNAITVDSSFSWEEEDPVYFGTDAAPDIGAYPYRANGYSIANNLNYDDGDSVSQGDILVIASVNDPEIVRFVEFYIDGMPVAVDNQAPYEYVWDASGEGDHEIKAIVRPLYADKTLAYVDSAKVTIGGLVSCAGADLEPCDGIISIAELISFIDSWRVGSVSIQEVMQAINLWKG